MAVVNLILFQCHRKLELFYDEMKKEFDEVCWKMKQGNLLVFVKDMTYHLTDLQYTKGKIHNII